MKLQQVDEQLVGEHHYLSESDEVHFLREYYAGQGFEGGKTNSLILNLKKSPDRRGRPEWRYKQLAIDQFAEELAAAVPFPADTTWVPVPPSKAKSDPLYDGRLLDVLHKAYPKYHGAIRELVVQTRSTEQAHTNAAGRPTPEQLCDLYQIDGSVSALGQWTVIFDDVLTTGCHFKAMERTILSRFPTTRCVGVFLARCIHAEENDDF